MIPPAVLRLGPTRQVLRLAAAAIIAGALAFTSGARAASAAPPDIARACHGKRLTTRERVVGGLWKAIVSCGTSPRPLDSCRLAHAVGQHCTPGQGRTTETTPIVCGNLGRTWLDRFAGEHQALTKRRVRRHKNREKTTRAIQ